MLSRLKRRGNVVQRLLIGRKWMIFFGFIERLEVVDLPPIGRNFTWFSSDGRVLSHLDKKFISDGLVDL